MSLASETRATVRDEPVLYDALAAGVANYAAVARELDVEGDIDAITAALGRFAEELHTPIETESEATVRMKSGLEPVDEDDAEVLHVGGRGYTAGTGSFTGVFATGDLGARALERALGRLRSHDVTIEAAGVTDGTLLIVVGRRDGADAVRLLEGLYTVGQNV